MNALPLHVNNLSVSIDGKPLLRHLNFVVGAGERVGFIGGSGSGKTLTALAVAGLLPENATVSGSIRLGDRELIGLSESELATIRGDLIGMVFQEPKTALNPLQKLGKQITEALTTHYNLSRSERTQEALELATSVGLREPERIIQSYPHQVSGGQRQRVAIAAAIAAHPGLLVADEPTTALDVTVQKGVLELFERITRDNESSLVFITHDLAVLSGLADRIYVFHDGEIIEEGTTDQLITHPKHEITKTLLTAARQGERALHLYEATDA